jgi:hypothetical protein
MRTLNACVSKGRLCGGTCWAGCVLQSDDLCTATGDNDAASSTTLREDRYRLDVMSQSHRCPTGLRYYGVAING